MIKIVRSPRVFSRIEQLGVEESGEGVPSPQKKIFLNFLHGNSVFWCTLHTVFEQTAHYGRYSGSSPESGGILF